MDRGRAIVVTGGARPRESAPLAAKPSEAGTSTVGLGRCELPTSRLSGALVWAQITAFCRHSHDGPRDLPTSGSNHAVLCQDQSTPESDSLRPGPGRRRSLLRTRGPCLTLASHRVAPGSALPVASTGPAAVPTPRRTPARRRDRIVLPSVHFIRVPTPRWHNDHDNLHIARPDRGRRYLRVWPRHGPERRASATN